MTSLFFWEDIPSHKIEILDLFTSSPKTFVLPKMSHISPEVNDWRTFFWLQLLMLFFITDVSLQ